MTQTILFAVGLIILVAFLLIPRKKKIKESDQEVPVESHPMDKLTEILQKMPKELYQLRFQGKYSNIYYEYVDYLLHNKTTYKQGDLAKIDTKAYIQFKEFELDVDPEEVVNFIDLYSKAKCMISTIDVQTFYSSGPFIIENNKIYFFYVSRYLSDSAIRNRLNKYQSEKGLVVGERA